MFSELSLRYCFTVTSIRTVICMLRCASQAFFSPWWQWGTGLRAATETEFPNSEKNLLWPRKQGLLQCDRGRLYVRILRMNLSCTARHVDLDTPESVPSHAPPYRGISTVKASDRWFWANVNSPRELPGWHESISSRDWRFLNPFEYNMRSIVLKAIRQNFPIWTWFIFCLYELLTIAIYAVQFTEWKRQSL